MGKKRKTLDKHSASYKEPKIGRIQKNENVSFQNKELKQCVEEECSGSYSKVQETESGSSESCAPGIVRSGLKRKDVDERVADSTCKMEQQYLQYQGKKRKRSDKLPKSIKTAESSAVGSIGSHSEEQKKCVDKESSGEGLSLETQEANNGAEVCGPDVTTTELRPEDADDTEVEYSHQAKKQLQDTKHPLGDIFKTSTLEIRTVLQNLKDILSQYPDSGQILKELVQNAEDAGASMFEVVHDPRNKIRDVNVDEIKSHVQGPGLLAYNDAEFTEDDWKGIKKLGISVKHDNPLKIGQFGLGFKSIFHFTDFVTIISGNNVLFMDPRKPDEEMCLECSLEKLDCIFPECLDLLGMYLQKDHIVEKFMPGTLFYFPLRKEESELSSTIYEENKVESLFHSFTVEAPLCLTFLKSLESIAIKKRLKKDTVTVLKVELDNTNLAAVRQERKHFKNKLADCKGFPKEPVTCRYSMTVNTQHRNGSSSQQSYEILHYLPSSIQTKSHQSFPLVGIAAPMPSKSSTAAGKIFCFLPLPLESANDTALPVQINGHFILEQNRRHVKWQTEESGEEDFDAIWNENLVTNILADAYTNLLSEIRSDVMCMKKSVESWYSLLPVVKQASSDGRWDALSCKVWEQLLNHPLLYSEVKKKLLHPKEVVCVNSLDAFQELVSASVKAVLGDLNVPLASVPKDIVKTLCNINAEPKILMPSLARGYLKDCKLSEDWNRLHLLEYIISDGQWEGLDDIELLPLENGAWTTFRRKDKRVFVCSREEAEALKGTEDRLLRIDLTDKVIKQLQEFAAQDTTVLQTFSPACHIQELLPISVNHLMEKFPDQAHSQKWLRKVWSLLGEVDLQVVKDLTIVPIVSSVERVEKLVSLSLTLVVKDEQSEVPESLIGCLEHLGITVLRILPEYVRHPDLHHYYSKLNSHGISEALGKVLSFRNVCEVTASFNLKRSEEQRLAFCRLVEVHNMKPQVREALQKCNLFKAVDRGNYVDVCLSDISRMYPEENDIPVYPSELLIQPCNPKVRSLALDLGASVVTKKELCLLALSSDYSEEDRMKLGWYILNNPSLCKNEKIYLKLKEMPFISSVIGRVDVASRFYDPKDINIEALIGEDLVPDKKFERHLTTLKDLGMKSVIDLSKEEIVEIAKKVLEKNLHSTVLKKKLRALFAMIDCRKDCEQICLSLKHIKCIYGVTKKPSDYPKKLVWATKDILYEPLDVKSDQFIGVVGSVVPLADFKHLKNITHSFGWNVAPCIDNVIQHLKNILKVCPTPVHMSGSVCYTFLKKIYCILQKSLEEESYSESLMLLKKMPFIFTRNGFKMPHEIFLSSGKSDLQLLPYMDPLPFDLAENRDLFIHLGSFESQSIELYLHVLKLIKEEHNSNNNADVDHDLQIINSVLLKIVNYQNEIDPKRLVLPVETTRETLELVGVEQCAYVDYSCSWLNGDDGEDLDVRIVHKSVGNEIAQKLGVRSLSKHLSSDEASVMEWGQHEPLPTRIQNLLMEYHDGVAVLKELAQNADDAGASRLYFLYDERLNLGCHTKLLTKQLKDFQGPALWAYNNASFTEQDFENLCKLGGRTKELKSEKIGKFGLGFCSVYNLTDLPSLLSGNNYIIFDPQQKFLEEKLGVRYDFSRKMNQIMLQKCCDQFQPFSDVFGCKVQETKNFDGTLFRFPLRTTTQAYESKLCKQAYSCKEMSELLKMFSEIIGEVLLFSQNIREIKVFLLESDIHPNRMELLYESSKEVYEMLNPVNQVKVSYNKLWNVAQLFDQNQKWNGQNFNEIAIHNISVMCSEMGRKLFGSEEGIWVVSWLTSWSSGGGDTCQRAEKCNCKMLPLGSVAVPMKLQDGICTPIALADLPLGFYKESHMHCFLPLPLRAVLPLQFNGCFDVASSRTHLQTKTEDDRFIREEDDWNTLLMKDAVTSAYMGTVFTLRDKGLAEDIPYFSLWPGVCENEDSLPIVKALTSSFYYMIEVNDLKVFRKKSEWYSLSQCCFLADSIFYNEKIGGIVTEVMDMLLENNRQIVELPERVVRYFGERITSSIVSEDSFYCEYFLPKINCIQIDSEKMAKIIIHVIDTHKPFIEKLSDISCIPTKPQGTLRKPCELVNPKSKWADLFTVVDERFPYDAFLEGDRHVILDSLGMMSTVLESEVVVERAQLVNGMHCLSCAEFRSRRVLTYLERNIEQAKEIAEEVRSVPFIAVKPRPNDWSLKWKGDECPEKIYVSCSDHERDSIAILSFAVPTALCAPELHEIAGSTHYIHGLTGDKYDNYEKEICKTLGIITDQNNLPVEIVIEQLLEYSDNCESLDQVGLKKVCFDIYEYLDHQAELGVDLSYLNNVKILITKHGFQEPKLFALNVNSDCSPALFSSQREGFGRFDCMMKSLGVPTEFSYETVFEVLVRKKMDLHSVTLEDDIVILFSNLLNLLFYSRGNGTNEGLNLQDLALPSSKGILTPIQDLCIEDGIPLRNVSLSVLHEKVLHSQEMLKWLGIQAKSKKFLKNASNRFRFGQKESLIVRLKNIVESYPCDSGIMNEFLQNADDAGATEVMFINDKRTLSKEKIFDEKWSPLQGPALCVYNNKGFTQKDLTGIQDLGSSCKINDPTAIGQYGIGFNVVYHLTDAPSFITRGKNVPGNETLCLFDPHCMYDPGATEDYPGVQLGELDSLRKAFPDTFKGYLENLLKDEGTVFRLPLRTYEESKIGKLMRSWELDDLLEKFKVDMKVCLLFLKNVRKISIWTINKKGEWSKDYYTESVIADETKLNELSAMMKKRKNESCGDDDDFDVFYFLDQQRISYELQVRDSEQNEHLWMIVHQIGSDDSIHLPKELLQAFTEKSLKLLPHAAVAVLLESNEAVNSNVFRNFCYLPLPEQSGLPFCTNGHFALDNSRRNLWTGSVSNTNDCKGLWNNWLLEEVLVHALVEALQLYINSKFPQNEQLTGKEYNDKIKKYYSILPTCKYASSDRWKNMVKSFYTVVKTQEIPLFHVCIPVDDKFLKDEEHVFVSQPSYERGEQNVPESSKGIVTWNALYESGTKFPLYFAEDLDNGTANTLCRLGMKLSSSEIHKDLIEAGIDIHRVDAECVLEFLTSWNWEECHDRCRPALNSDIGQTPFLSVENVCKILDYIKGIENFDDKLYSLPLVVTRDNVLRYFDEQCPIYYTAFGHILQNFRAKFLHLQQFDYMKKNLKLNVSNIKFLKFFTLPEFANHLPEEIGIKYNSAELMPFNEIAESHGITWVTDVWKYIDSQSFRPNSPLDALDSWALYPVKHKQESCLISVKKSCMVLDPSLHGIDASKHLPVHSIKNLPVPHSVDHIGSSAYSKLSIKLDDRDGLLNLLYNWREELAAVASENFPLRNLVDYFAENFTYQYYISGDCRKIFGNVFQLKSLKIYEDINGTVCSLNKCFIVPMNYGNLLDYLREIGSATHTIILKYRSNLVNDLCDYLGGSCIDGMYELFIRFILPNLSNLPESRHCEILGCFLRLLLNETSTFEKCNCVLNWLYEWRGVLGKLTSDNPSDFKDLAKFFQIHCGKNMDGKVLHSLPQSKLRSLKIYEDIGGNLCNLERDFIVPSKHEHLFDHLQEIGSATFTVVLKSKPNSVNDLYDYLKESSVKHELELYSEFLLPYLNVLPESSYKEIMEYLKFLLDKDKECILRYNYLDKDKECILRDEVIKVLQKTPFILLDEKLVTADKIFDPSLPLFKVMKIANLPSKWAKKEWHDFICLAGMQSEVSPDLFISIANRLSAQDNDIQKKSNLLVKYLHSRIKDFENEIDAIKHKDFENEIDAIKQIEFLVPDKDEYEQLCSYYSTSSGLISFASSAQSMYKKVLWTAMSILPQYVEDLKWPKGFLSTDLPEEKLLQHICNITSIKVVCNVKICEDIMKNIYNHLSKDLVERIQKLNIPLVYLPSKKLFVKMDVVSQNDDIGRYLYKVPGIYKKLLEQLGVFHKLRCDQLTEVLKKIYDCCQNHKLNPEQVRCMKLAMSALVGRVYELKDISSDNLFLPTRDGRLQESRKIFVSDNKEYERIIKKNKNIPLFVGLKGLGIQKRDTEFVHNLPENLRPKFLSEVVKEEFDPAKHREVKSEDVNKIKTFVSSSDFQKGILRLMQHYQIQCGLLMNDDEIEEIKKKLTCVDVKAVKRISINLKMSENLLGSRTRRYFLRTEVRNDCGSHMLYISPDIPVSLIIQGLTEMYVALFSHMKISFDFRDISGIMQCLEHPQDIEKWLDERNIRDFGEQLEDDTVNTSSFQLEVGAAVDLAFINHLVPRSYLFQEGEYAALEKNPPSGSGCSTDLKQKEYILVEIKGRVKSTGDHKCDEYAIFVKRQGAGTKKIVVKAEMLHKFT